MKNLYLALFLFLAIQSTAQPPVEWAEAFGTENYDDVADMVFDDDGNVYITGTYDGIVDIDPGPDEVMINSNGAQSMFVQKLNSSGDLIWYYAINFGTVTNGYGIDIDNLGNVYVAGTFQSVADFDTGPGNAFLSALDLYSGFLLKLSPSGQFSWVKDLQGSGGGDAMKVVFDGNVGLYVVGQYAGVMDANPGAATNNLTSTSGLDIFIVKLNIGGNYVWSGSIGADEYQMVNRMAFDSAGDLVIAGQFAGSGDFDPTAGTSTLTSNSFTEVFLVKITGSGEFVFAHSFGGSDNDEVYDLAIDSQDNILISGNYFGSADFDIEGEMDVLTSIAFADIFLVKLQPDASLIWARSVGSASSDIVSTITTDNSDNIYFSIPCYLPVDFDLGEGESLYSQTDNSDIIVAKYTSDAELIWVSQFGGEGNETPKHIRAFDEDVLYMAGLYSGTTILGSEEFTSASDRDVFALRMSCISYGVENVSACDQFTWPVNGMTYTVDGIYEGTLVNTSGCDSLITLNLEITSVNVGIDQNGQTLTAEQDDAEYQWINCGTNTDIPGAIGQSYTATSNGSFGVEVTVGDCISFSDCITITDIALDDIEKNSFMLWPNPAKNSFQISAPQMIQSLSIFDCSGRIVKMVSVNSMGFNCDVSQLESELYFMQIVFADGTMKNKKLVIE